MTRKISFKTPEVGKIARHNQGEWIIILGKMFGFNDRTMCVGWGRVDYIEKGEKFDIVKMNFGTNYSRKVVVTHNHARKQIYTLKLGQYAMFVGYYMFITEKEKKRKVFFARALQGLFVPKAMDIKRADKTDVNIMNEEEEKDLFNFLDDVMKKMNEE